MLTRVLRKRQEEDGFTLIELLVVIIIIGILAAIAIPVFINQRGKAQDAAAEANVRNAAIAAETFYQTATTDSPAGGGNSYTAMDATSLSNFGYTGTAMTAIVVSTAAGGFANQKYCISQTSGTGTIYKYVGGKNGAVALGNGTGACVAAAALN